MSRFRAAMEIRCEDRSVNRKIYTPGNLETLELSMRLGRTAQVCLSNPACRVGQGHICARLLESWLAAYQRKVTSCLAWSSQRIAPIRLLMRRTCTNLQDYRFQS